MKKKKCVDTFRRDRSRPLDEPVAGTYEEAEEFLEEAMAAEADTLKEVRAYLEESGADVSHMSDQELKEAQEVFALGDGGYLIVEG